MKTKKVTFWGGFHNSNGITISVDENQIQDLKPGFFGLSDLLWRLSSSQLNRLSRHFCGVPGCRCGGVYCADFEID